MDIFKLTKSKTRERILQYYFSDPDKKYYLRQLEKLLGMPVGNIRRELISLHKSGLFKKEAVGNQVYYYLNKESAYYKDLKSIVFKTIGIEGKLRSELKEISGIEKAFIFGSFANNKENSASDIDLMIVGKVDDDHLIKRVSKLENVFNREINYHLFGSTEWKKKSKINSFLIEVNKGSRITLI